MARFVRVRGPRIPFQRQSEAHSRNLALIFSMQLVWYERRAKFQPEVSSESGVEDKEVVLLEETDVNPLGCIAGKCAVFITADAEEVRQTALKWAPSDSPLTHSSPLLCGQACTT